MKLAIIWIIVVSVLTIILLFIYRKKEKYSKETMGIPRGFFRVVILFTFIALYIYSVITKNESILESSLDDNMTLVISFYFGNHLINTIKNG